MSEEALPCLVCGKALKNTDSDLENQPYKGTAFTTHGHYGSTIFDPMDGQFLEINVCDECLEEAGEKGKVLLSRSSRLVLTSRSVVVGFQKVNREYVKWKKGVEYPAPDTKVDCLKVDEEEIGKDLENVTWTVSN